MTKDTLKSLRAERDKFRDGLHDAVTKANAETMEVRERLGALGAANVELHAEVERLKRDRATAQLRRQVAELERRCDWLLERLTGGTTQNPDYEDCCTTGACMEDD